MNPKAVFVVLALGLVAAGAVTGAVLAVRGGDGGELTRTAYLQRTNAICAAYGKRLDTIPPPLDPASPGAVYESIGRALPILREQLAKVRALAPPRTLEAQVDRFLDLTDRSLDHLGRARERAGKRELFPMVQSLSAFGEVRDDAKRVARSIGFKC